MHLATSLPYQFDTGNFRFDKPRDCEGSAGCARRVTPPTTITQSRLKSVNQFINQPINQQHQLNVRFRPQLPAALWNHNYFLRFRFRLLKSYGSGSKEI
jgi:hypothetical protein